MRRRYRRLLFISIAIGVAVLTAAIFGTGFFRNRISELRSTIEALNLRIAEQEAKTVTVYCASKDVLRGEKVTPDILTPVSIDRLSVPEDALLSPQISGNLRIGCKSGTMITKGMIASSEETDDVRRVEYSSVRITGPVQSFSKVDVRLLYPDGTDYIVLAGKDIYGISEDRQSIELLVNEEELLLMDSAAVDAFLYGAGLYTTVYIEPELQRAAVVDYIPSQQTMELIRNDPNIASVANEYLSSALRGELEERLSGGDEDEQQ